MTANVSNSGVRNLRAMFENKKEDEASESRSRSPAGSTASENRRTSRVRASFVSVEAGSPQAETEAPSSASARRASFSLSDPQDSDRIAELKKTVSQEKEERKQSRVAEIIPESAIEATPTASPAIKPRKDKAMGDFINTSFMGTKNSALASKDIAGTNPDKVVSAVEESPATMRPTDPKDANAVSGGEALPPPAKPIPNLSAETSQGNSGFDNTSRNGPASKPNSVKQPAVKQNGTVAAKSQSSGKPTETRHAIKTTTSRPSTVSTKPSSTAKPTGASTAPKSPNTKQSRTSLESTKSTTSMRSSTATRPTTASAAKKAESTSTATEGTKAKPRSPTRPVKLPSHLTAPTASSAAKHGDANPTASSTVRKPAPRPATNTSKPPPTRRDGPRQSLPGTSAARPSESRASTRAPDDGFLARMMRPTASSASKTAEKPNEKAEVKSPPKRASSVRSKASVSSLTGKTKRTVPAVRKGKEVEQNGSAAQDEDHPEGEASVFTENLASPGAPHQSLQGPQEATEALQPDEAQNHAGAAIQQSHEPVQDAVMDGVSESAKDAVPEAAKDLALGAGKDSTGEAAEEAALFEAAQGSAKEPALEPSSEPISLLPQTPTKSESAAELTPVSTPEAAKATTTEATGEQATDAVHQDPQDGPVNGEKEAKRTAKVDEEGTEPSVETTPEQVRTADPALEQTPAFDGAAIR